MYWTTCQVRTRNVHFLAVKTFGVCLHAAIKFETNPSCVGLTTSMRLECSKSKSEFERKTRPVRLIAKVSSYMWVCCTAVLCVTTQRTAAKHTTYIRVTPGFGVKWGTRKLKNHFISNKEPIISSFLRGDWYKLSRWKTQRCEELKLDLVDKAWCLEFWDALDISKRPKLWHFHFLTKSWLIFTNLK